MHSPFELGSALHVFTVGFGHFAQYVKDILIGRADILIGRADILIGRAGDILIGR